MAGLRDVIRDLIFSPSAEWQKDQRNTPHPPLAFVVTKILSQDF